MNEIINKMKLPEELAALLRKTSCLVPESRDQLLELAMNGQKDIFEVKYDVPGKGETVEATVTRCKNGLVINYPDIYLRRRDPDSLVVADSLPSDKETYEARFGEKFDGVRTATFEWLEQHELIVMPLIAGDEDLCYNMLLVAPKNAAFFAAGLADLQKFIPSAEVEDGFTPRAVIYLAPVFRYTHFEGRQVVVHNRREDIYELFSYNTYPGPSAKKGVYGVLIKLGEDEGWVTIHGSTVMVVTPYENIITIMHEGASGGGKSEMTEQLHRETDGRILLGLNTVTNEQIIISLREACELRPVTDDMALCHPSYQTEQKRLVVRDAEHGWFLRTDHIKSYGAAPDLEEMTIHPKQPLIFLNYEAYPGSTCLIWEHIEDKPGKKCPNPRVIMPRRFVPNIADEAVEVDVRSFGVRTPPCTAENPSYGIMGVMHLLPPAIAWLWRLVAPRGYDNPSITVDDAMSSEGVGSYWPFATGRKVDQANLLLRQICGTLDTRYVLIPNQHIGAYKVGFKPQWIAREYLARRGHSSFTSKQIIESRCPLLGYSFLNMKVDGEFIPSELLEVHRQPEVGFAGYDTGAVMLTDFFKRELESFRGPNLYKLGMNIIDCCLSNGSVRDYLDFIPMKL